jgi:hypothetical protein
MEHNLFGHEVLRCDGCGAEITWAPVISQAPNSTKRFHYCCRDCQDGSGCDCGERMVFEEERRTASGVPSAWPV